MSLAVDMDLLSRRLEARFGLAITNASEVVDGGIFPVIRPAGLEQGTGFCIVVARTHRQIEASFRADNFAAGLLRRMADADESACGTFGALVAEARENSAQVYVAINGNPIEIIPAQGDSWKRIELDVSHRISSQHLQPEAISDLLLLVTSSCLSMVLTLLSAEQTNGSLLAGVEEGLPEGALIRIEVNKYERSPANRAACIAHYGTACQACELNFSDVYGELGEGYIEVHHQVPVSRMGDNYFVNPVKDLIPVCSNCHSMLHRVAPPMTLGDLREIIQDHGKKEDS